MNEWMNHLYSAFIVYCYTPKALYNHVGGLSLTTTRCLQTDKDGISLMHRTFVLFFSRTGDVLDVFLWSRDRRDFVKYVPIPGFVVPGKTNLKATGFLEKCVRLN